MGRDKGEKRSGKARRSSKATVRHMPGDEAAERVEASTMPDRADEPHRRPPFWRQRRYRRLWPLILLAPVVGVIAGFAIDRALHDGQVLRGVALAGHRLTGLDREGARGILATYESEIRAEPLLVRVQQKSFELAPETVGLALQADAALDQALGVGREGGLATQLGSWLASWSRDATVEPACTLDEAALAALIDTWESEGIQDPPYEGAIVVEDEKPVAKPPRAGHRIDRQSAARAVTTALCTKNRAPLDVPLEEVPPARKPAATAAALAIAEELLRAPLTLVGELPPPPAEEPDDQSRARAPKPTAAKAEKKGDEPEAPPTARFTFEPKALAAALKSRLVGADGIELYLDAATLEPSLVEARRELERTPVDAKIVVERGDEIRVIPSHVGRVIDAKKVAKALFDAAQSPEREAKLPIDEGAQPKLSSADVEALHIKGLVSSFTTTHPCCRPRVDNIHKIADLVDGVLLRPGERFSINEHVGERTVKAGFKPAPTIVHGEMKDTIGGGISQFATTFFNAALNGGYEIIERQPHSYYFSRYPMGHEATLSFPKPDVIIRNDTDAGLLIKTYYTGVSITVKLYGDNGGRKVKRKVSNIFDLTDAPIEYVADDSLEPDEKKVKARGKKGWTVTVSRIIAFPDGTEKKESRKVVYNPRVRIVRVHSCMIPKGEEGYTGNPCPEPEEDENEEGDEPVAVAEPTEAAPDEEDAD